MKDIIIRNIPKDAVYKDVVIIGNGPSGISLSYMLSGNWPYWSPEKVKNHPDEILRARLNYADCNKSLIEQDLIELAEGLEGRSTNPLSLLLDSLEHPCADLGMELPSMLEYKHNPNAKIDHIVLGKGPPGGSWHRMDPNLRTLSLAAWMSLPGLSFSEWEQMQIVKETSHQNGRIKNSLLVLNGDLLKDSHQCEKCIEIRKKQQKYHSTRIHNRQYHQKHMRIFLKNHASFQKNSEMLNNNNNNESETGALCCKCTKVLAATTTTIPINAENFLKINQSSNIYCSTNYNKKENLKHLPINNHSTAINKIPPRRNLSLKRQISKEVQTRALVSRVAQYYEDYVNIMNLDKNFLNNAVVTLITPLHESCLQGKYKSARWFVMGINKSTGRPFYYVCGNVVLANGASDLANKLGLKGESMSNSWVKHELPHLEAALEALNEKERQTLKPVLVVGAGLSAADAVTICRSSDIPVIHVFRSRTAGLDKMLPENVYPEYHEVHRMMKDPKGVYEYYTPIPEHTISDLITDNNGIHKVTVENLITHETETFEISFCAILIGSKPDLRFISGGSKEQPAKRISVVSSTSTEEKSDKIIADNSNSDVLIVTPSPILSTVPSSPIASPSISLIRKLTWLKSLCAKCKHLNLCDWNHRTSIEYQKVCNQICTNAANNHKNSETIIRSKSDFMVCPMQEAGLGLGDDPTKPIDCKTNQVAVDKYTNRVLRSPKGLYAMGPLVGDNFVRFIPGGALAITAALHREND